MAAPAPIPSGTPPTITGFARVGRTLHASDGAWLGNPTSYRKQWLRGNAEIEGACEPDYDPQPEDVGEIIRVRGFASNASGESVSVTSEGVGPVRAATIPPIPIPPEPPGNYPPSIITPVVGTPLPHVWDLQHRGTGPRGFGNGQWQGELDAYLAGLGFFIGNYGDLCIDVGDGEVAIEGYSFDGAPNLNLGGGDGIITLTDCRYAGGCNPAWPRDINANIHFNGGLTVIHNRCEWDVSTSYQGSGQTEFNGCKMTGQLQGFCDVGNLEDGQGGDTSTIYRNCYIPGGGVAPAWLAHVELARVPAGAGGGGRRKFILFETMVDISACGQANTQPWGSAWTGVWSIGDIETEFDSCIMIGAPAVNANPENPNTVGCVYAFSAVGEGRQSGRFTNTVMEPGLYGYTFNHSGTANRAVDGGGNRSLQNEALSAGDFASISLGEARRRLACR
jgi:hypothetical protein